MRVRIRIGTICLVFTIAVLELFRRDPSLTRRSRNHTGMRFPAETQRRRDKRREEKASSTKGEKNSASSWSVFSALACDCHSRNFAERDSANQIGRAHV